MPRYTHADELSRAKFHPLPYTHIIPADIKDVEAYERGWNDAIDAIIENAPTADVVEVVRCKDCRWYDLTDPCGTLTPNAHRCKRVTRLWMEDNAFCAYGESREEPTMEEYMYGQEGSEEDGSL